MILVGELALWIALLMAAWGAIVSFAGGHAHRADLVASGARAIYATFGCVVLSTAGLLVALVTSDFTVRYVASFTSANLPIVYKLSALWVGGAGSLLFWTLILSTYAAVAITTTRADGRRFMAYVAGTLSAIMLFCIATLCLSANPYERLAFPPPDGRGMNPLLQSLGMVGHVPTLYVGSVAAAVAFALTIGALLARQLDDGWLAAVRRSSLVSWFFLTIGALVGMWWAYVEPDWAGRWALDSVANASFLPWLSTTAFLYSTMTREHRPVGRTWGVVLAPASFLLAVAAAFIRRGGIISSVDALGPSETGVSFAWFLIVSIAIVIYLVATRRRELPAYLDAEPSVSRQTLSRRRYGGYVLSAGVVIVSVAFVGNTFKKGTPVALGPGETAAIVDPYGRRWAFTSQGISDFAELNRSVVAVALQTTRDGEPQGLITSERRQYVDSRGIATFEPSTKPGIAYSLEQDTYVVLGAVEDDRAELHVAFNPLVVWVWIGGAMITMGGLIVMGPVVSHGTSLVVSASTSNAATVGATLR